jgi:peroxiredoxin
LVQLRDLEPDLIQMGIQLLAVSPDRPAKLRETIAKHNLGYRLLSDSNMSAAQAFHIAYRVDEGTLKYLREHGIDLEEASGEGHHLLPVPAVFLVGTDGLIQFEYVNPDYRVRLQPDLLLAAAKVVRK